MDFAQTVLRTELTATGNVPSHLSALIESGTMIQDSGSAAVGGAGSCTSQSRAAKRSAQIATTQLGIPRNRKSGVELAGMGNEAAVIFATIEGAVFCLTAETLAEVHVPIGELRALADVARHQLVIRFPERVGAMRFLSSPSCLVRAAA